MLFPFQEPMNMILSYLKRGKRPVGGPMNTTITKLIGALIFLIILSMLMTLFIKQRLKGFVMDGYVIISAETFRIVQYTKAHPEGIILYQLYGPADYPSNDYDITAVAYDPERKLIAIAQESIFDAYHPGKPVAQQNKPRRGTALIKLFD